MSCEVWSEGRLGQSAWILSVTWEVIVLACQSVWHRATVLGKVQKKSYWKAMACNPIVVFTTAPNWNHPKCPWRGREQWKSWGVHINETESFLTVKRNKMQMCVKWKNFKLLCASASGQVPLHRSHLGTDSNRQIVETKKRKERERDTTKVWMPWKINKYQAASPVETTSEQEGLHRENYLCQ